MSTAFVKNKLKAAREAIGKKDYQTAHDASAQILEYEPDNYNAKVFLGLSLLELGQVERSEQTYLSAIGLNPKQPLALQGLSKAYERAEKWDQYVETLTNLAELFHKAGDVTKCAETVQKVVDFRRQRGSRRQLAEALALYLPESPFYPTLSSLPQPDATNPTATTTFDAQSSIHNSLPILEEIVSLVEREEEDHIKREVDNRRKRLNAGSPEDIRREVGREVYSISKLPPLYNEILNHPNTSDELRRLTESKLLRHKRAYLSALPTVGEKAEFKKKLAAEVQELVNGIVLLQIPDELAWTLFIDGKNSETIEGYDYDILAQFRRLFPSAPLSHLVRGFFLYMDIKPSEDEGEASDDGSEPAPDEDAFDIMLEAAANLQTSIIAQRILAEVYLWEMDYQNAMLTAEAGLDLVRRQVEDTGTDIPLVRKAFHVDLCTALVHWYPPKHHVRALRIIDEILLQDPKNVRSLMGRGYILQREGNWTEALSMFSLVMDVLPKDDNESTRAREEHAWCQVQLHQLDEGVAELNTALDLLVGLENKEEDQARCNWRLGKAYWESQAFDKSYTHFINALKCSATFAPAFTSLGIYYLEAANPPDPNRASKCFQKAFELDAREGDAARRLAEGFAEEREWDLVDVVAKRTIEGEGGLEGEGKTEPITPARYLPVNAWAWKASGVVDLIRRNYPAAIQAFQVALRVDAEDQLSWLRLGEAYTKAGRHVAAVKALNRAHELKPDDWICSYFIGDVQRQTGQFQEAIASFESILRDRSNEPGVLMTLAQTHMDLGTMELSTGFISRAEGSFVTALQVASQFLDSSSGFRGIAWKTIADAVYHLSQSSSFADEPAVRAVLSDIVSLVTLDPGDRLAGILPVPLSLPQTTLAGLDCLKVAVAAYNYRISLGSHDTAATGSAWYDFGLSLHTLAQQLFPDGSDRQKVCKQAISCITEALRADPRDEAYWRTLGDMNFTSQAKTAQHAYIKALEINSKDAVTWTSLGLLYLHHDDPELANEALLRAQTLDSDYSVAWVGQALVATHNGHTAEARSLLEHAVSLTAAQPAADLEYARREFQRQPKAALALFPAFFVLDRYVKQRPADASALHLFALVCERIGHAELAREVAGRAIGVLEAAYEETEDPVLERRFTVATVSLARLRLAAGDYAGAGEAYQTALGLLGDAEEGADEGAETRALRVQCHFGMGVASMKMGMVGEAVEMFEGALDAAGGELQVRGHVVVMLAQTLWATGTEEGRESAKAQLLECITADPENLTAINALAGMGILTDDDSLVDAAVSEILALPPDKRRARDSQRDVAYLLTQHHLAQGDVGEARSHAQKAVFAEPARADGRRALAVLALQSGETAAARAVLAGAGSGADVEEARKTAGLRAIAEAEGGEGDEARRLAQKAVLLEPWNARNWEVLAYATSRGARN
ncbi:superkiller protein 3 SKI3 [Artomyces pyxidatus]|uniref:Superkiller protein 3 SKI3 n=1 Tax=Artomyces pyxidatus TaxID=48021 RepID=A0ACB8T6E7_9AGAM|nr:superkiller protein 3 SKI3 [Artomyces pyxidatus]